MSQQTKIATLGGGCFWCLEAVFEQLRGVEKVESGYAGGQTPEPTYKAVCSGTTGHAEVVQITFDPVAIAYRELLEVFFAIHDPTTLNRQGNDVGSQSRSVIFTHSPEQQRTAEGVIHELTEQKVWPGALVTEVVPFTKFYKGEDYHQGYYRANPAQPYCQLVVNPKVVKARKAFAAKMRV